MFCFSENSRERFHFNQIALQDRSYIGERVFTKGFISMKECNKIDVYFNECHKRVYWPYIICAKIIP